MPSGLETTLKPVAAAPDRGDGADLQSVGPGWAAGPEAVVAGVAGVAGSTATERPRVVVIGCGALGRELVSLTRGIPGVKVLGIDARLHMRPALIAGAVERRIAEVRERWGDDPTIFVAYADCGTVGALDVVLQREGVERIAGAHCFEFYAGAATYAALQDEELGTFYLTDFLARQFESLVLRGLGLDRHPELLPDYFGAYRRVVYLAQTDDPELTARAEAAADHLGLAFERRVTGLGELDPTIRTAIAGGS